MADADPFLRFVAARLNLAEADLPDTSAVNDAGNTLGTICVRLGLLDVTQIEDVLAVQREHRHLRFGQIAVEQGFMNEAHIKPVLALQGFYRSFEIAMLLVLAGHITLPQLVAWWSEFATEREAQPR